MYHYDPTTALEEIKEEALPDPVTFETRSCGIG
jgi:hypothetical protein